MKQLPLYETAPTLPGIEMPGSELDDGCTACPMHINAKSVCLGAMADHYVGPGGLYVVTGAPTKTESGAGIPFVSPSTELVVNYIREKWKGSVVFDNALRCATGDIEVKPEHVAACRPYLANIIQEAQPSRVIAVGSVAGAAVFGHSIVPLSMRRGYGWTSDRKVPAFVLPDARPTAYNRFLRKDWKDDLKWALTATPRLPPWDAVFHIVETVDDAIAAVNVFRQHAWSSYDTETSGVMFDGDRSYYEVVTLAVCPKGTDTAYVWDHHAMRNPAVLEPLAKYLEDPRTRVVGHNIKYDHLACSAIKHRPIIVRGTYGDTRLWRKLDESDVNAKLDYVSVQVGMGGAKHEATAEMKMRVKQIQNARNKVNAGHIFLPGTLSPPVQAAVDHPELDEQTFAYGLMRPSIRNRYCARDAVVTARAGEDMEPRVYSTPSHRHTWETMWRQSSEALAQIERWGFLTDINAIRLSERFLAAELSSCTQKLMAWGQFNPRSDDETRAKLYTDLGLPVLTLTKKAQQPATSSKALKRLRGQHPIIPLLERFSELDTMQSRYAAGMLKFVRGDGRIHCRFKIDGTRTGRMSSSDPNLQNIPSRSPLLSKMIKNCFIAPHGSLLIQLDYSQLEFRMAAILAKDPVFRQVFIDGHDLHRRTAELIAPVVWGTSTADAQLMSDDDIDPWRSASKTVNFGLFYGMSDGTLAAQLGTTREMAAAIRQAILGKFSVTAAWIDATLDYARRNGHTWTHIDGERARSRQLWRIASPDDGERITAENGSYNTDVQGSASYYMLRSLIAITDWIVDDCVPAKVVNSVHDSAILEAPDDVADEVALTSRDIMQGWWSDGVPLIADIEAGRAWGSLVKLKHTRRGWERKDGKTFATIAEAVDAA